VEKPDAPRLEEPRPNLGQAQDNTARTFFCLQEESGTAETGARKNASVLLTTDASSADRRSLALQPAECMQNHLVCGKTPAYPQQPMCKSRFFAR
jgi:hypothetical protein